MSIRVKSMKRPQLSIMVSTLALSLAGFALRVEKGCRVIKRIEGEALLDKRIIGRRIGRQRGNDQILHIFEIRLCFDGDTRVVAVPDADRFLARQVRTERYETRLTPSPGAYARDRRMGRVGNDRRFRD
jgi:hypothetical protein